MEVQIRLIKGAAFTGGIIFLFLAVRLSSIINTEESIIDFIVHQIQEDPNCTTCEVISATKILASFLNPRREYNESVFSYGGQGQLINNSPITTVIVNGGGSCGYSSELGVRVFERLGYSARFVQILGARQQTRHVVMDAEKDGVYAVIDPIFGHIHLDSLGNFASLEYLSGHWDEVKVTLPRDTKIGQYSYEYGVQFTNWKRFGAFTDYIQKALELAGFDVYGISLRVWFNLLRRTMPEFLFGSSIMCFLATLWLDLRFYRQ